MSSSSMPSAPDDQETDLPEDLGPSVRIVLLGSITVVAMCGIVYELIIGAVSSYLLGNSVYQFSITIGFFMFAMGIGSWLSQFVRRDLISTFIRIEILLGLIGGLSAIGLFLAFPLSPPLYRVVMISFILMIGTLVGLEIPLLVRIFSRFSGTRKSVANVLSLDYIGALFGSVAFPLLLLPELGLVRASFAIGVANVLVALVTLVYLRDRIDRLAPLVMFGIGTLIVLVALTISASRINAFAQQHLYYDDIVWKTQSPYQSLVVTRDPRGNDLRLYIDGHLQFAQSDEHRYHEALVHPVMNFEGDRSRVLVLGGGDGLAVRELLKYEDITRIDLVDLDPEIIRLAKEFPAMVRMNGDSLSDPRVHVHTEDAFVYIRSAECCFDRVIIDMPDPHDAALSKLYSVEFYAMIGAKMAPDGVLVTQASSPYVARRTYWTISASLADRFAATQAYHTALPSFGVWGFHLASLDPDRFLTVPPARVPAEFWSPSVQAASYVFPADIDKPETLAPNSIFEPRLYQVYLNDLRTPR